MAAATAWGPVRPGWDIATRHRARRRPDDHPSARHRAHPHRTLAGTQTLELSTVIRSPVLEVGCTIPGNSFGLRPARVVSTSSMVTTGAKLARSGMISGSKSL